MADGTKRTGFVAWLVALVVPPVVAGGLGQQFVSHHPAWAVVMGVAYEATVAIGGFFAVIARDVAARWQVRLADNIDLFLQRKAPRFERRYRDWVLAGLRFMDHKGLATVGPFTPELDAVFVDVSLAPCSPQRIGSGILPELADERLVRRTLTDFLGRDQPTVLAVVGAPGSGKTTLLRHAARQACLGKRSRRGRRNQVPSMPVLLYLRDHAAAIITDPGISIAALLRTTLGSAATDEPPGWFERKLLAGECLVLLDGLDEVPLQDDRAKVSAWAEGQVRQYPGNDFVISSRPRGYQSAPLDGAEIVQVCGFTVGQVEAFVRGWYRAAERHSTGTVSAEADALGTEGAGDLLQRLEEAPALYDLTVNPLLLTMIANVHRYLGALPGSRADLYSEICQVMLWRRQDAKKLPLQIAGDKKEAILRNLAYIMMEQRVSDLHRADVLATIQPTLRRASRKVTPDEFLTDVSSNGLLVERENGQYAFAHKTFQEYLAAAHIRDSGLVDVLADTVGDDWWAETALLYAARSNADVIVRACLSDNSAPALVLALDCTEQDSDIDPELRRRVNELVISAADPKADPERRRLFAVTLLARHVLQRERTTAGVQVCVRPISVDIYRLFMADTGIPEPDTPLAESGIAVGMRAEDAVAFARWATVLSGGQRSYLLPLATELSELADRHRIPVRSEGRFQCPWTQAGKAAPGTPPVLWLLQGTPDPYEMTNAALADAYRRDAFSPVFTLSALLLRSRLQVRALALALTLTRARVPVTDLDLDLALDRADSLDQALVRSLARARSFARALDLSLDIDLNRALDGLDRVFTLDRTRDLALDLALACGPADDLDLGLVRLDRAANLDRALNLAFDLTVRIDDTINRYMSSGSSHDRNRQVLDEVYRSFLGRAFSGAITEALRDRNQPGSWKDRFAAAFIDAADASGTGKLSVDPADMEATLQDAAGELANSLKEKLADQPRVVWWCSTMAERLRDDAMPVFSRTERPTPGKTAEIRMSALCLAAEANGIGRDDIGEQFRRLGAGITLRQRRATGEQQAVEVIMLAID